VKLVKSVHTLELTEFDRRGLQRDIEHFFMGYKNEADGGFLNSLYVRLRLNDNEESNVDPR